MQSNSKQEASASCAAIAVLAIAPFVLFIRMPDRFFNPQFLLEDGSVFFIQAYDLGAASLWRTYSGYHVLLARIGAFLGTFVAVQDAPAFYNFFSLACTLAVLAYIMSPRVNLRYKPLLALTVVLAPSDSRWLFMSLTVLYWPLSLALLAALFIREARGISGVLADALVVAISGLSGPLVVCFLPLFVYRAVIERSRHALFLLSIAAVCAAVQMSALAQHYADRGPGTFDLFHPAWPYVLTQAFGRFIFYGTVPWSETAAVVAAAVLLLLYVLLAVFAVTKKEGRVVLLLAAGLLVVLTALYSYRGAPDLILGHISRYSFVSCVTMIWAWFQLLHYPVLRPSLFALLLVSAAAAAFTFRAPALPDYHWAAASSCIGGPSSCRVPIGGDWFIDYVYPPEQARKRYQDPQ
jgi:hypothetical protein